MNRAAVVLSVCIVAAFWGCGGSDESAPPSAPVTRMTATSPEPIGQVSLEEAARSALEENFQLSDYVLWRNRVPTWARDSTRGPALAALRRSAADRRNEGIRLRSLSRRLQIERMRVEPSYDRAIAAVRTHGRVRPYRGDRRLGGVLNIDERGEVLLRRVDDTARFVVWKVTPLQ